MRRAGRIDLPPGKEHATNSGYNAGCSCPSCCEAHAAYVRENNALRRAGVVGYVPAKDVMRHIAKLQRHMSLNAIAVAAGRPSNTVWRIARGDHERVTREVAESIFAVQRPPRVPGSTVNRQEAERLIHLMRKAGHSRREIARAAGVSCESIRPRQRGVYTSTLRKLEEAARTFGVVVEREPVVLDLKDAPIGSLDPSTARAASRARAGLPVTLSVARRICDGLGLELAEAAS